MRKSMIQEESMQKESSGRVVIRPRICVVTSTHPDFDGRIWRHCTGLATGGYDVDLVCPWIAEDNEVRDGVRLHPFKRVTGKLKRQFVIPFRLFRKLLPLLPKSDLVHFHDFNTILEMTLLSLFKPVVYDVHENYPEEMLARGYRIPPLAAKALYHAVYWLQWICARIIRNIVLVAPSYDACFASKRLRRIFIRNFMPLRLLEDAKDDYLRRDDIVIFNGSQYLTNGTLLALDIAERCKARIPTLKFWLSDRFWDMRFREEVVQVIRERDLWNVSLIPQVKPFEIVGLLSRATIALSPSLRVEQQIKGMHGKIGEYLAAALPIVCSDLPNEAESVGKNNAGLLAQPEDPESFVNAIGRLVSDRAAAEIMGKNGQKAFIEKYSWESQLPTLAQFYADIIARKPISDCRYGDDSSGVLS
jgi:glycosyltransferase involved in cell wall biosynthesis